MRLAFTILFLLLAAVGFAQNQKVTLHFAAKYNGETVILEDKYYSLPNGDSIAFDVLRYYITGISFYNGNRQVFAEKESYHLIDHSKENTTTIELDMPGKDYNMLRFNLGVDSVTNTSGALTGDLDPGKGMYWAWQSGYINFKLEGRSNACLTRRHEFSFHLGGYLAPGYAMQTISKPIHNTTDIFITIALDKFIQAIDLTKQNSIMIPGEEAVELSQKAAASFEIK